MPPLCVALPAVQGAFAACGDVAVRQVAGHLENLGHAGELAGAAQVLRKLEHAIERCVECYTPLLQATEAS